MIDTLDSSPLIVPLDCSRHSRLLFACGLDELDRYLKQYAGQDQKRRFAAPYVMVVPPDEATIVGFYILSNFTIDISSLPDLLHKKLPYPEIPATLIGRLAVDNRFKGKGYGELLLLNALFRCALNSKIIASWLVVVDAINESAKSFYQKFGFLQTIDHPMRLYLTMADVENLL